METNEKSNAVLWSISLALTFFWILNILKEAYGNIKAFLNFYPPTGPLLGLFISSILFAFVAYIIFMLVKPRNQKLSFWVYFISSIVFFLMVFPPFFEPVVDFLKFP